MSAIENSGCSNGMALVMIEVVVMMTMLLKINSQVSNTEIGVIFGSDHGARFDGNIDDDDDV